MNRTNFGQLLTPIHRKIFFESYMELMPQYVKFCDVGTMNKATETMPHMGAFGPWEENNEGGVINEDEMSQGDTATFTARRFDKGYEVTWELVRDDLYNVMAGYGKNGRSAMALGRGLNATIEQDVADVINNGFANTGYDGVSLFSASHPLADSSSLGVNLLTGKLNDINLKNAAIVMRETPDEAGVRAKITPNQLLVPIWLEYTAKDVQSSRGPADELSNNENTTPMLDIVVLDYLTSETAWVLRSKQVENFKMLWRDRPIFDSQPIPKKVDKFFFGYARFDSGYADWRGAVGSTGATA
jgi:phage major head subunit gpT-like protein